MRGDDTFAFEAQQIGDHRLGDCLPFVGIRASAQFVDKDEGIFIRIFGDLDHVFHVRRKSGKIFFDTLGIPDIAKNIFKYRNRTRARGRNKYPAASHQTEQSAHFERDRLAARIRSGNQKQVILVAQRNADGDRRLCVQ